MFSPGWTHNRLTLQTPLNSRRDKLKSGTAIVFLEDILTRHQHGFESRTVNEIDLKLLNSLAVWYVQKLMIDNRPLAAIEFSRKIVAAQRNRTKFDERYAYGRLARSLELLYTLLRNFNGDPKERWAVVQEANRVTEQLTPHDWENDAARTLRMQRAQILQFYTSEELQQAKTTAEYKKAVRRAIANHEMILRLGSGIAGEDVAGTRVMSLQAICRLKEDETDDDYRVYAREFQIAARPETDEIDSMMARRYLASFVASAQAHIRTRNWEEAMMSIDEGLGTSSTYNWPDNDGPFVELCRLYVHRSQCRLKKVDREPVQALMDAREAYRIAKTMPSNNNTDPSASLINISGDEHRKHDLINFSLNNLVDVLYERDVECPEEEYGLKAANAGILHNKSPDHTEFATIFQRKRLRALLRLERWTEVLSSSRDLLKALIQQLSTTAKLQDVVNDIVTCCESAADSLYKLGHDDAAAKLEDAADDFDDYVAKNSGLSPSTFEIKAQVLESQLEGAIQGTVSDTDRTVQPLQATTSANPLQIESPKTPGRIASLVSRFIGDEKNTKG